MTAISDTSSALLARTLDAARHQDPLAQDNGGMTDCWPVDRGPGDVLEPGDPGDVLEPGDPGDVFDPRDPGGILVPDDREIFVDDNGQIGWRTVVRGTSGDDTINVTLNADGSADVEVNGETTHYPAEDARNMRVDGGAGDDTITVTDNRLRVFGQGGDVTIEGGSGDDNISGDLGGVDADGGTGDDTINGLPEFKPLPFPIEPLPRDPGFPPFLPERPGSEPPIYIPL